MKTLVEMAHEFGFLGLTKELEMLTRLEAMIREDEREACAKVCDGEAAFVKSDNDGGYDAAKDCAAAIRARGNSNVQ